jgi:hypothetical protein
MCIQSKAADGLFRTFAAPSLLVCFFGGVTNLGMAFAQ